MTNSIVDFFKRLFGRDLTTTEIVDWDSAEIKARMAADETYIREIAFYSCVNIVANAVSKCEFVTYRGGAKVQGPEYYLWNYSPNLNECSSEFIQKWVTMLYLNNEALVIEVNGQLLVADSYVHKEYALYEDVFTNVTVRDFTLNNSFTMSDVLFFKLSSMDMRRITAGLAESYQRLWDYTATAYQRSRGSHGLLKINATKPGMRGPTDTSKNDEMKSTLNKQNKMFKSFFESDNAVIPIMNGYDFVPLDSKTYANDGTRDLRAMIDDVADFTARAFSIPPALLNGTVEGTEQALEHFLTFCIDPLCDMIQCEITRKRYGEDNFLHGNYLRIDTKAIRHIDLMDVATNIDKLISSGAFCINDIRALTGEAPIDSDFADQHWMTKNYATVEDLLNGMTSDGSTPEDGSGEDGGDNG